jgi:hypothetical protein
MSAAKGDICCEICTPNWIIEKRFCRGMRILVHLRVPILPPVPVTPPLPCICTGFVTPLPISVPVTTHCPYIRTGHAPSPYIRNGHSPLSLLPVPVTPQLSISVTVTLSSPYIRTGHAPFLYPYRPGPISLYPYRPHPLHPYIRTGPLPLPMSVPVTAPFPYIRSGPVPLSLHPYRSRLLSPPNHTGHLLSLLLHSHRARPTYIRTRLLRLGAHMQFLVGRLKVALSDYHRII